MPYSIPVQHSRHLFLSSTSSSFNLLQLRLEPFSFPYHQPIKAQAFINLSVLRPLNPSTYKILTTLKPSYLTFLGAFFPAQPKIHATEKTNAVPKRQPKTTNHKPNHKPTTHKPPFMLSVLYSPSSRLNINRVRIHNILCYSMLHRFLTLNINRSPQNAERHGSDPMNCFILGQNTCPWDEETTWLHSTPEGHANRHWQTLSSISVGKVSWITLV